MCLLKTGDPLTLLHSERPKLHAILAFLSAIGLIEVTTTSRIDCKWVIEIMRSNCCNTKNYAIVIR